MATTSKTYPSLERKPGVSNWVDAAGGLPPYIERIAKHLHYEQGYPIGRSIAVAVNAARRMCATGDTNLPGAQQVNAKSRAEACRAVAQWEAKKTKAAQRSGGFMPQLEERTVDVDVREIEAEGNTLRGYAAVFNVESEDLGGFRERIAPGAFAGVLPDADVRLLVDHKPPPLARTKAGTLRLSEDDKGLSFEADLPDTQYARDLRESVKRGDLDGMSFRFGVGDEDWEGDVRTVKSVATLSDVCLATYPAYPAASVELRTRPPESPAPDEVEMENRNGGGSLTVEDRDGAPADEQRSIDERVTAALAAVRKGESRALTDASADPITPPELSAYLFDRLRTDSVALKSGVRVITTDRESIQWPRVVSDPTPGWYAELDTITASDPVFATLTATPRKLAVRTEFSNEVLEDSVPDAGQVVRNLMLKALAEKFDLAFFEGSGSSNQPTGLRNVSGIQTVSLGTNGAALTNLDPVADAIGLLEAANVPGPYVAVANPRTWGAIRKLKDTTNRPLLEPSSAKDAAPRVLDVPFYVTSKISVTDTQGSASNASSIYVYSTAPDAGPVVVKRTEAAVELDRSRLFDKDASEMRGRLRATVIAPQPLAIVRIVGVTP